MLIEWAEEKMSLACIMADLLDMHVLQLDKDLQGLEAELDVCLSFLATLTHAQVRAAFG